MGDPGGVCHQPEAADRADEHEQRHGEQHVSWKIEKKQNKLAEGFWRFNTPLQDLQ